MSTSGAFNTVAPSGSDYHWRVPAGVAPTLILSSSQDERSHASIFNHTVGSLYIRFGSNAGLVSSGSAVFFDAKIASGTLYELPKPVWQGDVWGVWDSPTGWAMVVALGAAD